MRNELRHPSADKDDEVFPDDPKKALELVDREYTSTSSEDHPKIDRFTPFGAIFPFSSVERRQLESVRDLVLGYVSQSAPPRPLCVAVFGPPGSGKSFSVKQIKSEVEKELKAAKVDLKLPMTTLNLTQSPDASTLRKALARIAGEQDEKTVPIVFFDEFDARRSGARYGWLSWFLSPMHDGEFMNEGAVVRLKRAVYVFAGGTADTLDDFSARQGDDAFRAAKGPDFISRLRGFLDVRGPNAKPRMLRRALIVRKELDDRVKGLGAGIKLRPDSKLLTALLQADRYRHGARSITAVLEISRIDAAAPKLELGNLPEDHLLKLHVDRGPLDLDVIGGCIAVSGGAHGADQKSVESTWTSLAVSLWQEGATLAYGGNWEPGGLTSALVDKLKSQPPALRRSGTDPRLRLLSVPLTPHTEKIEGVRIEAAQGLTPAEQQELGADADHRWLGKVLELFRMRLQVAEASLAKFAMAGKTAGFSGRFPGIAEEIMLTLALGRPVYVAGGFGGAASDVGYLLGLGRPWTGDHSLSFSSADDPARVKLLEEVADRLQPPPLLGLPVTTAQLIDFLKKHAVGERRWPDNGLTVDENRDLFACTDPAEVSRMVTRGLVRRFDGK